MKKTIIAFVMLIALGITAPPSSQARSGFNYLNMTGVNVKISFKPVPIQGGVVFPGFDACESHHSPEIPHRRGWSCNSNCQGGIKIKCFVKSGTIEKGQYVSGNTATTICLDIVNKKLILLDGITLNCPKPKFEAPEKPTPGSTY